MKTAVSLPDELFEQAESAARKLKVSRSKLYAAALRDYLERREAQTITKRLNEVYSRHSAKADRGLLRAQLRSLEKDPW